VNIFGFADPFSYANASQILELYLKKYNSKTPNIYYLETFSAMQIIFQLFKNDSCITVEEINRNLFDTAVGVIKFEKGESNVKHLAVWESKSDSLVTV
jgi:hypothetical protein